jgi:acyl carrier protein
MIPSVFIEMDRFPLTANNKVDKKSLPSPEIQAGGPTGTFVPPSTPTQKKLARIWESTLKTEKIGILDDFFEAGGHSMIAASMINKIEKEFGTRLPLSALFERSTIEGLAVLIDAGTDTTGKRPQVRSKTASSSLLSSISTLFNKKS